MSQIFVYENVLYKNIPNIFLGWACIVLVTVLFGIYTLMNKEVVYYKHNKLPLISEAIYETEILLPLRILLVFAFLFVYYRPSPFFFLGLTFLFLSFAYNKPVLKSNHTYYVLVALFCILVDIFTDIKVHIFLKVTLIILTVAIVMAVILVNRSHAKDDPDFDASIEWSRSNLYFIEYLLVAVLIFLLYCQLKNYTKKTIKKIRQFYY